MTPSICSLNQVLKIRYEYSNVQQIITENKWRAMVEDVFRNTLEGNICSTPNVDHLFTAL